uniref:Uncharacterized protein n=1 Tax=Planktothrix agardhii TaxID=1160 RepID=A0A1J1JJ23_PLAAG|nr:protein of unknown function [Planktothrix agardhii]
MVRGFKTLIKLLLKVRAGGLKLYSPPFQRMGTFGYFWVRFSF